MLRFTTLLVLATLTVTASDDAHAQSSEVAPGDPVRVTAGGTVFEGSLLGYDDDVIRIHLNGESVSLLREGSRVEVGRSGAYVLPATLIGALAGGLLGSMAGTETGYRTCTRPVIDIFSYGGCTQARKYTRKDPVAALIGMAVGGGLGLVVSQSLISYSDAGFGARSGLSIAPEFRSGVGFSARLTMGNN